MALYLRFSENIEADVERGTSIHVTELNPSSVNEAIEWFFPEDKDSLENADNYTIEEVIQKYFDTDHEFVYSEEFKCYVEVLPGLCAFELEAETLEEAFEEAKSLNRDAYSTKYNDNWHILQANYCGDCPEGDLIENITVLYSNK